MLSCGHLTKIYHFWCWWLSSARLRKEWRKGRIVFFVVAGGQEVIWPGVGQTIFLSGPLGTHAAGTSGDSEERSGSQQQQKRLTNDPNLFGEGDDSALASAHSILHRFLSNKCYNSRTKGCVILKWKLRFTVFETMSPTRLRDFKKLVAFRQSSCMYL